MIDATNKDTFSFEIPTKGTTFQTFLMYGATSKNKPFMYIVFIDVIVNNREVTLTKIVDSYSSRVFTGNYSTEKQTLSISCNSEVYGGVRLIALK